MSIWEDFGDLWGHGIWPLGEGWVRVSHVHSVHYMEETCSLWSWDSALHILGGLSWGCGWTAACQTSTSLMETFIEPSKPGSLTAPFQVHEVPLLTASYHITKKKWGSSIQSLHSLIYEILPWELKLILFLQSASQSPQALWNETVV